MDRWPSRKPSLGELCWRNRDERGRPVRIQGTNAEWMEAEGGWRLHEGTMTIIPEQEGAEPVVEPVGFYKTDVRPADLLVENRSPFDLSYGQILVLTERYPLNPNGSPGGLTGFTSTDGRATILMPHPERVFRTVTNSWAPAGWGEDGPWLRMFRNARHWLG